MVGLLQGVGAFNILLKSSISLMALAIWFVQSPFFQYSIEIISTLKLLDRTPGWWRMYFQYSIEITSKSKKYVRYEDLSLSIFY